jgi:hypothetical protein
VTALRRLALAAMLAGAAPGAVAQPSSRPILPDVGIGADPPRSDPAARVMRRITVVQLDHEGAPLGVGLTLTCPATGCQDVVTLVVEGRPEQFTEAVTFVANGTYFALEPRSLGTARIVEHRAGRAGPAFIGTRAGAMATRDLRYVVSRDATVRSVNRAPEAKSTPNTLSDGNVFTRKIESDVTVRVAVQVEEP